uniref:Uncharacterized protein n=1 Tax=myxobacterium MSr12020 TaxID=2993535 RepID=A0A9E8IIH8_9BACT|nr:hypothetical protein [myxobacterium MSr12020]
MNTMKISYLLGCLALLVASGCVVETEDAELAEESADTQEATSEDTATAMQAISSVGDVGWSPGQPALGLGPSSDRVCFLTGIKGNFAASGDLIRVYVSNGSWYLSGSGPSGVAGWAACAYVTPFSGEYKWESGQNYPTALGSASKRMCFITRVSGSFNSTSDWVHLYGQSGQWFMTGESTASDVKFGARCVAAEYGLEKSWGNNDLGTYVGTSAGQSCGLTKISGNFDNSQDFLHCDRTTDSWYLTGKATSGSLGGRARLF